MSTRSPNHGWSRLARLLVGSLSATLVGLVAPACVDDVGLVDRTQPYKLEKTLFEGAWLYQQTTIEVPFSSAVSFAGEQPFLGGTQKIVFDLQEKWLVAYPIVETVDGSEKEWKRHAIRKYWDPKHRDEFLEMYVGAPVARWPIESHFDVQRSYNTFNGAQSNEVVENTTDRPWYERDYVRVSWHRQGIQDFFFSLKGAGNSYFVGEERPFDPDELTVDAAGGYFDFVIRTVTWSVGQDRCNIYDLSPYDCAETEVKVRHSFRRFDPRRDYEPIYYHNDEQQNRFGFFATERPAYDSDWGPSYKGQVAFANRWNLWQHTFEFVKPTDAAGAEQTIACVLDSECDRAAGQRCQKNTSWFGEGYCATPKPMPYSKRGFRPVIYHLNADWHPDFLEAAYQSADSWNDVFQEAVAWAMLYEAKGLAQPRACETHADCANADLLADVTLPVSQPGTPCHADLDCGTNTCAADGFCGRARTCDAASPCALGQTCAGGVCQAGGAPVLSRVPGTTPRSSSLVFAGAELFQATHDSFPARIRQALPGGHAYVRFLNLAPADGALGLTVNGVTLAGGAYAADRDLDPADPATTPFMAAVPAGMAVTATVTAGGAAKGEVKFDIVANAQYLVVWNGHDVVAAGESFSRTTPGIRGINAGFGAGAVDFAVGGVRFAEALPYQGASAYVATAGASQRATISRSGGRGDFTCYQTDTIGSCAGWASAVTDADRDFVRVTKSNLPDMFVLCENQFDAIAAGETVTDREHTYADARYTRNGYNPCGDPARVAHPEALKKMGDTRYSFFYWVNAPQRSGPLGYGPSQADPETGEIIVANANIYGGSLLTYGQYAMDLIDLENGDRTLSELMTGDYIREYLKNVADVNDETKAIVGALEANPPVSEHSAFGKRHFHAAPERLPSANLPFSADLDRALAMKLKAPVRTVEDYEIPELLELQANPQRFLQGLRDSLPKVDPKFYQDRLNRVAGTWIDDLLVNDEVRIAANALDPNGTMNAADLRKAISPTAWSSKTSLRAEHERMKLLGEHCLYLGEFADDAIYGLAKEMKNSGLSRAEAKKVVSNRILRGVLEHEVGHTVGLRHNFSGSTDVFNFLDPYYSTREREHILCQDDSWCDDAGGEACAIQTCTSDAQCVPGTLCSANRCSAPSGSSGAGLVPTGVCSFPKSTPATCNTDAACGEGGVCYQNRCYAANQQFAPRPWMTDSEKANKRTEYQYSTIMDYGGRFNSDVHGLGKYDYAAIRFGYTQLVDTYTDPSHVEERIQKTAQLTGSSPSTYSFYKNTDYWPTRGSGTFHAFNYLTNYIGVDANLKRTPVPYHLVKNQAKMATNDVREFLDLAYVQVPYAYCSDEFRGNMGCYYFDQGIDMGEMAQGAIDQLSNYYVFDAFKRERLFYGSYGNPLGYYARLMDRYFRVLGDVGMYYALYDNYFFRYSWYDNWKRSPLGGRTMEQAALTAYARLKDVIAAPSPGSYKLDPTVGAYVNTSFKQNAPGSDFSIPFGIGRYPFTQFGSDLGYYFYQYPLWFGSFWEKLGALVTLTDSTAYFVDTYVGEQIDIGVGTSLGYNTVFSNDLNNFLSGIVTGNLDFYAGRNIQGRYVPPSIAQSQPAATPIVPAINTFTMKLYAALYGLAFLPAGFDPQYIDRMAVFLEGEATQYTRDPLATQEVRFEDPIGGKVYIAYSTNYGTTGQPKLDVGATLVTQAQDLADDWEAESDPALKIKLQKQLGEVREVLDLLRSLNHVYGTSTLGF